MTLPLVLAGPILRRVDAAGCTVFMALSQPSIVEMRIWPGAQTSNGRGTVVSGTAILASGSAATRKFGANLHIAVVTVDLAAGAALQPGRLHSYDVMIGNENLRSLGLLQDERPNSRLNGVNAAAPLHLALGYGPDRLPGFVTPGDTLATLRLAHASCRRPNHDSQDAMAWLDDQLEAGRADAAGKWPQQLFLTGDQIYADDVAAAHLHMVNRLGREVMGGADRLPVGGTDRDVTLDNFPPLRRGVTVRGHALLSTTESASHLLGFGEYAAMYLCAWSPRVWRPLGTVNEIFDSTVPPAAMANFVTNWTVRYTGADANAKFAAWKADEKYGQKPAENQAAAVVTYREAVPKVARALANVATYMIWDDHEVTDDWNLAGQWVKRVYDSAAGRAIIRNGMMAYGLFQAWGNDPKAFADNANNRDFLTEAEAILAGNGPFPAASTVRMEELLGFGGAAANRRAIWHYRVDGPRHRVVVLDTRSRRNTGTAASVAPPGLLGDTLDAQLPAGPLADGRELLIVVSPPPVLGPSLFDDVLQPVGAAFKDAANSIARLVSTPGAPGTPAEQLDNLLNAQAGHEFVDVEGWASNDVLREALLARLATYRRVVLLSGDVHYACTLTMDYWKGSGDPSRIVQLTSSGARNGWPVVLESAFRNVGMLRGELQEMKVERVAWERPGAIVPGGIVGPGRSVQMLQTPCLLPTTGWPPQTSTSKEPDWRWRAQIVTDERPVGTDSRQLPVPGSSTNIPDDDDIAATYDPYVAMLRRHAAATRMKPRLLRTVVFISNLGLIGFSGAGATAEVTHTLLSAASELKDERKAKANTLHKTSLGTPAGTLPPRPPQHP